jgi:undecaprenyl-diphosphatase
MIGGGVLLLFVDQWFRKSEINQVDDLNNKMALKIGLFQCLAIIFPGLSRSAATIIGAMSQKVSKEVAAEFSFFLAVPTMFAATAYKSLTFINTNGMFNSDQLKLMLIGNLVAFIVALLAIRFFITMVKNRGFRMFGIYRLVVGFLVLLLVHFNIIHS